MNKSSMSAEWVRGVGYRPMAWLMLLMLAGIPQLAHSQCNRGMLHGLYGLATQGIGPSGETVATLSVFDFSPDQRRVTEIYFVDTARGQRKSTALGSYQISPDCHFTLSVIDLSGRDYALEGEFNPNDHTVQVMQTVANDDSVAVGVIRRVGLNSCSASTVSRSYVFLSQGIDSGAYQARVGRLSSSRLGLDQTAETVNTAGVFSETAPALLPITVGRHCLAELLDGGYPAVIVEGGQRLLYLGGGSGTIRTGQFISNR